MKKLIDNLKKIIDNLNNTQKILLVLFILNPFLSGLYQTIDPTKTRGRGRSTHIFNDDELLIMIGVSLALLVGVFLFKSKNDK